MVHHHGLQNQFMLRWMLLGLALLVSVQGAGAQLLPVPPSVSPLIPPLIPPPIPLPLPASPVFSSPQDVSNGRVTTYQMAADSAGNVNLAWQSAFPSDVFFSRSSDQGRTFSAPVDLSNAQVNEGSFQIAVDSSGNIYAAWFDFNANVISVVRSTDGGASFSGPVQISTSPGPPSLTLDSSGNLFLCWTTSAVPRSIFCSQSADGGATFSSPVKVTDLNRGFLPPLIAVDGAGNINLAWVDDFLIFNGDSSNHAVFFSRSSDAGATFSPPQQLSDFLQIPPTLSMALDPSGNINVLWESIPHGNVFLSRSNDGGATFLRSQITSYVNAGSSPSPESPRMALDSTGNINVVWFDGSPGVLAILYSRSTDGGASFSTPQNVSGVTQDSRIPQIALDSNGNIDVVWEERTPGTPTNMFISDIFFSQSKDNGASFSTPQNLSNDSGGSFASAIGVDSCGNINVAWMDETPGTLDLFFSRGATSTSVLGVCVPLPLR